MALHAAAVRARASNYAARFNLLPPPPLLLWKSATIQKGLTGLHPLGLTNKQHTPTRLCRKTAATMQGVPCSQAI